MTPLISHNNADRNRNDSPCADVDLQNCDDCNSNSLLILIILISITIFSWHHQNYAYSIHTEKNWFENPWCNFCFTLQNQDHRDPPSSAADWAPQRSVPFLTSRVRRGRYRQRQRRHGSRRQRRAGHGGHPGGPDRGLPQGAFNGDFVNGGFWAGWWFGCHEFYFPINIGLLIIPIDFHIFQRGGPTTNQ